MKKRLISSVHFFNGNLRKWMVVIDYVETAAAGVPSRCRTTPWLTVSTLFCPLRVHDQVNKSSSSRRLSVPDLFLPLINVVDENALSPTDFLDKYMVVLFLKMDYTLATLITFPNPLPVLPIVVGLFTQIIGESACNDEIVVDRYITGICVK